MIFLVYLYPTSRLSDVKTIQCETLEQAQELEKIGEEDGYYKYLLIVYYNNMPIETKFIYYDNYDYNKATTRKKER